MKFQRRNPRGGSATTSAEVVAVREGGCDRDRWDSGGKHPPSDRSPMCLIPLRLGIPGKRRKGQVPKATTTTTEPNVTGQEAAAATRRSSTSSSSSVPSAIAHLQALKNGSAQNADPGDDTQWDWRALAEALHREESSRDEPPSDEVDDDVQHGGVEDEEDDILVQTNEATTASLQPPSLDAENASIDAVIRKVAMLRAPLRFDEPELTPIDVQERWLRAAVGAIESEKLRQLQQGQQKPRIRADANDDAPRDPTPGSEVRIVPVGDRAPKQAPRGRDPLGVDRRDDEETSLRGSLRQRLDPSPDRQAIGSSRRGRGSREQIRDNAEAEIAHLNDSRHPAPAENEAAEENDASVASNSSNDDIVEFERDVIDEVTSSRLEEPKQSDYVYLQIEKRNTSGDDDISVSSMEYLFNWLTCVNVEEELQHKRRLADPAKKSKGKTHGSALQADANAVGTAKKLKHKRVKAPPSSASPQRTAPSSPRKARFSSVRDDAVGSRRQTSPARRRLVEPPSQNGLNYRPSLQRGNRSSGTVTTLSTAERITNIIDRTDAWLQIGRLEETNMTHDDDDDLDAEGMGEEVQLSPKRKPTLQVPRDEVVRYHPTLSGREPSTAGKPQRARGKRVSMRSRKEKSRT